MVTYSISGNLGNIPVLRTLNTTKKREQASEKFLTGTSKPGVFTMTASSLNESAIPFDAIANFYLFFCSLFSVSCEWFSSLFLREKRWVFFKMSHLETCPACQQNTQISYFTSLLLNSKLYSANKCQRKRMNKIRRTHFNMHSHYIHTVIFYKLIRLRLTYY